ncbi:hypothetical protein Bbelb_307680 [Branchiostoma belcheri]|nr:hypothetical protein Bbelb_307680 [Branchiostoma belcheri]
MGLNGILPYGAAGILSTATAAERHALVMAGNVIEEEKSKLVVMFGKLGEISKNKFKAYTNFNIEVVGKFEQDKYREGFVFEADVYDLFNPQKKSGAERLGFFSLYSSGFQVLADRRTEGESGEGTPQQQLR